MANRKRSLRQRRKQQHEERKRARRLRWAAIAGALVLVALGLFAFSATGGDGDPAVGDGVSPANVQGPADAPVSVVEFGDFGCPSCRAWHNSGVKAQLLAEFGDQISFTFRHLPVITPQSPKAAEAGQCAADQDAFWQYHDYLYEQAAPGRLSPADLKQYAVMLGLDRRALASCLDSGRYQDYVEQDIQAARELGARGTPSFFVNGQPVNLFTYESAVTAISRHLP